MSQAESSGKFAQLIKSVFKFGMVSGLATICDFALFTFVFSKILPVFWAEIISAFIGMVINFYMQKRFVFSLKRKASQAFLMSLGTSIIIMFVGAFTLKALTQISIFAQYLVLAKILVMGGKFILNFHTKKWVFEK